MPSRLAFLILTLGSFLCLHSQAQTQALIDLPAPGEDRKSLMGQRNDSAHFGCAIDTNTKKVDTEAQAGCLDCLAAQTVSKEAEEISKTAKAALDVTEKVTKEKEREQFINEIRVYKLVLRRAQCPKVMTPSGNKKASLEEITSFLNFIEEHQPNFEKIFNSEAGLKNNRYVGLILQTAEFAKPGDRYRLEMHFVKNPDSILKDIPMSMRPTIQKSFKENYSHVKQSLQMQQEYHQKNKNSDVAKGNAKYVAKCESTQKLLKELDDPSVFKDMPLAELKTQVQRLEVVVKEDYKAFMDYNPCKMSTPEAVAIAWYTGSGYSGINAFLRGVQNDVRILPSEVDAFVAVANRALSKLRDYDDETLRGAELTDEQLGSYQDGRVVTEKAFVSSSVTQPFGGNTVFIIRSKTGKYLGPYSASQGEGEVLFAADTKFKVVEILKDKTAKKNFIVMEEVK